MVMTKNIPTKSILSCLRCCNGFKLNTFREHQGLGWTEISPRQGVGHYESGELFNQTVQLTNGLLARRVVAHLKRSTRQGDEQVAILSNLPVEIIASTLSELYLKRWKVEILDIIGN